jgi:thiol-disulfide isomerase/thioredoxin
MQWLLFLFLLTAFQVKIEAQTATVSKSCTLVIDTKGLNIDRTKSILVIRRSPENKIFEQGDVLKSKTYFVINTLQPFFAHVEIIRDSSILARSSDFIITDDIIKITFDSSSPEPKVSGGENEFYYKHRLLLFSLPALIADNPQFKTALLKNSYEPQLPDIRLRLYYNEFENNVIDMVSAHRSYYYILKKLLDRKDYFSLKSLEKCYSLLTDTLRNTSEGKELEQYIKQSKKLLIGQTVPAVNVLDELGVKHELTSVRDTAKFTLIDFWASWCLPCRESMKVIKKIYPQIDTSRFQIVAISIDKSKSNWLKAVEEDRMPWKNYYDPGGWEGQISKVFNLDYIPQNRIIDTTGRMIAFDLSPEELQQFLQQYNLLLK